MLILSRKIDETIIIADCIQVKVLRFDKTNVKLGIQAPINISILREEIYVREKMKHSSFYLLQNKDAFHNQEIIKS